MKLVRTSSLRLRRAKRYVSPFPLAPLVLRGTRFECPCCGGRWRRLLELNGRQNAVCPRCGSAERHRLLALFIDGRLGDRLGSGTRVLHFAPEPSIGWMLSHRSGVEYVSTDLRPGAAMVRADITNLPFEDEAFDLIFCSHVLEHVPDDRKAIAELFRVLRKGGLAVLQHPVDNDRPVTYEDPSITDPAQRLTEFGQDDHVRVYGADHADRLRDGGFAVEAIAPGQVADSESWQRCLLGTAQAAGDIYVCSK